MDVSINYWAVLGAAAASFIVGGLWYSPLLFAKPWMRMMGMRPDHKPEGAGPAMALAAVGALVAGYVLAHFVELLDITNLTMAYQFIFWTWLGIIAPVTSQKYIFNPDKKPWALFWLESGNTIVSLLAAITVLTLWN